MFNMRNRGTPLEETPLLETLEEDLQILEKLYYNVHTRETFEMSPEEINRLNEEMESANES